MRRATYALPAAAMLLGFSAIGVAAQDTPAAKGTGLLAELGYPELNLTTDGESFNVHVEIGASRTTSR